MDETNKLDEAFIRFETALRQFEAALARRAGDGKRVAELEAEAEKLAKAHGGSLKVSRSEALGGARFDLHLRSG